MRGACTRGLDVDLGGCVSPSLSTRMTALLSHVHAFAAVAIVNHVKHCKPLDCQYSAPGVKA